MNKRIIGLGIALAVLMAAKANGQQSSGQEGTEFETLITLAEEQMGAAEWEKAEQTIVEALRLQPASPMNSLLFSNLGVCQMNQGHYQEALETLDIALLRYPNSTKILSNQAQLHLLLGDMDRALEKIDEACRVDPGDKTLLKTRGLINFNRRDFEAANADFKKLWPDGSEPEADEEAGIIIIAARAAHAAGDTERVRSLYGSVAKEMQEADATVEAIVYFLDNGTDKETQSYVNQAISKFPEDGRLYLVAAVLCERGYQHSEADLNKKIAKQYGIDSQTIEFFMTQKTK